MSWLKVHTRIRRNRKVQQMPAELFRHLVNIWTLAKDENSDGELPPLADIAYELRLSDDQCQTVLNELAAMDLVNKRGKSFIVSDWKRWQFLDDSKNRVAKFRDKQRFSSVTSTVAPTVTETVTDCYGNSARVQSTEYRVQSTEHAPVTPTKFDPAYWVERLIELHPSPPDPRFIVTFCENNLHRLSCDEQRYSEFMSAVEQGLVEWCAYWAIDGNRYATGLEKWLAGGGWKKSPPATVTPTVNGKPRNRFVAPEED